jgi:hypothetical protein
MMFLFYFTEMASNTTPVSHNETNLIHESQRLLDSGTINDPVTLLRTHCLARGFSGFLALTRALHHADHGGNRYLNMSRFMSALHKAGFKLSDDEIDEIFNFFDTHGNGSLEISHVTEAVKVRKFVR